MSIWPFKARPKTWSPTQEIDMTRKYWGHSIEYLRSDGGTHKIAGWNHSLVRAGDCILDRFRRADGTEYVGHMLVSEVEWCGDPSDMFFATVHNLGAEAHNPIREPVQSKGNEVDG